MVLYIPTVNNEHKDDYLADQIPNLLGLSESTAGSVANGPTSLLFGFEFTMLKQMNKRRDKIGVNDRLNLIAVSGSNIGNCPASFFTNRLFRTREQTQ